MTVIRTTQPALHGVQHLADGSDPIPGLLSPPVGLAYNDYIASLQLDLLGYWRLGEGSSPYADTSGNLGGPANMTKNTALGGAAMTEDIPGALPAADDDGAVQFNSPGHTGDVLFTTAASGPGGVPSHRFSVENQDFTIAAWVSPLASGGTFTGHIVGPWQELLSGAYGGYRLGMEWPTRTPFFVRTNGTDSASSYGFPLSTKWHLLVGTFNYASGIQSFYVDGELLDTDTAAFPHNTANAPPVIGRVYSRNPGLTPYQSFYGGVDEVAIWGDELTAEQITQLYDAGHLGSGSAGSEGLVIGIDENGEIGWVQPKVDVTVNGEPAPEPDDPPAADEIVPPEDPNPIYLPDLNWIVDQPFVYDGPDFEVAPNKWVTIPFTQVSMQRQSNVSGYGTKYTEIDPDDPDAAGWVDPDYPHAITIPHDMGFNEGWFQICLRVESPAVQASTSSRILRVFETTHQKTLIQVGDWRDIVTNSPGFTNVFVEPEVIFAAIVTNPKVMFAPTSNTAWYTPGTMWLPGHETGSPTLKQGMRCIAQVKHNATIPLTFHCTEEAGGTYKPHFVFRRTMSRGWGPPWSTWPTYP